MMQCAWKWKGAMGALLLLLYGISAGAHTDHGVVIAGYSIELVVHAACSALHTCQADRSFRWRKIPVALLPGQRDGAEEPKGPATAAMPEEG